MNWREELRNFKKDPDVDKYLQMLTSDDEDTLKYGVAIIESKYPEIGKQFASSISDSDYATKEDYLEIRVIDWCRDKWFFASFLKLLHKKKLLKESIISNIYGNRGWAKYSDCKVVYYEDK